MSINFLFLSLLLPSAETLVYLFNTADSPSTQFYDCINQEGLFYCRRPMQQIILNRSDTRCHHRGTRYSFARIRSLQININTILHQWKSSIEKIEQYSRFLSSNVSDADDYLCNCSEPHVFGKHCEYLLPRNITFDQTLKSARALQRFNPRYEQLHGSIVCYRALECNSGLLCLDWREICDGTQQCMSGLDEDNCDLLEFVDCEQEEYRCMNGMCIPEEYFLDGDFDCLDWSDEIQYYDDTSCPIDSVSIQCDDRLCPPNQWSCGDGQCIVDRFNFQEGTEIKSQCRNRRDQYYICETNYGQRMWTLANGKCYDGDDYHENNLSQRTKPERCQYLLRCLLSRGAEASCPCSSNIACQLHLNNSCLSLTIPYPSKGIMAPYILFYYNRMRNTSNLRPDFSWINGSIKCYGKIRHLSGYIYPYISTLRHIEDSLCSYGKNESSFDRYACLNLTTNRTSGSVSMCLRSRKCISTSRLRDGFTNCLDQSDEWRNRSVDSRCSQSERFRFSCSIEEPTCLSVAALGNVQVDCKNSFDEVWLGNRTKLININCNQLWKYECPLLRRYVSQSWQEQRTIYTIAQARIPFRSYCDTFWDLARREDEDLVLCQRSWICPEQQWQCPTGQCIEKRWLSDGVWDCADGADEKNTMIEALFSDVCDMNVEYPCLLVNLSSNRPCLNRSRLGDGRVDCVGAIDERNTLEQCKMHTMLAYHFKCPSSTTCIPYWNHCLGERCEEHSDDQAWCNLRQESDVCIVNFDSIRCRNGTCVEKGRCNKVKDCELGEDEYMCEYQSILKLTTVPYRKDKESSTKTREQILPWLRYPSDWNVTDSSRLDSTRETPPGNSSLDSPSDSIAYSCNRGVGARFFNGSTVCFCPPQYYGEACQYHAHRIIVSFHLNLSQSIYSAHSDIQIVLKLLVLFLYDEEVVGTHIFHVRPSAELFVYSKKSIHFTYPFLLSARHPRPWQNSSHRPYSVRIETYEWMNSREPYLVAVWQYSIQFDFLPVYRFSKILHLTEPLVCSTSNPCNPHQDCHRLMNDPSQLICLCKSNRTGENCSVEDTLCMDEYCASQSLCKPMYRGLLTGNHYPYCICAFNRFGERCDVVHDRCTMTPCQNNGSCFSTSKPDVVTCQCPEGYLGKFCEVRRPVVKIMISEIEQHQAAVVEYLKIDSVSLNLILLHQRVFRTLPSLHMYQPGERLAPEIILVKLYFSSLEKAGRIHLLAIHLRADSIAGTGQLTEQNHCRHVRVIVAGDLSPIQYHSLCQNFSELLCFHDDYYLCICSNNNSRVECFHYDGNLDRCSRCLAGGRCLQGDRMDPSDFLCICPTCYSGVYCQFNLNSFTFTLDQLFFTDLISMQSQHRTKQLLINIPLLLFILSLPNNYFSFVTFHRSSCLSHGVGHYLRHMSIINPLNLAILAIRMIHLALNITGARSSPFALDNVLCKLLSFLLTSSNRMVYWLSSLVAIERIYMTLFLNGRWLKKPHMARRVIIVALLAVAVSDLHELFFIQSLFGIKDGRGSMCVFQFPVVYRSQWQAFHLILAVFHSIVPFIINLCSMITISCVVIKKKIKTQGRSKTTSGGTLTRREPSRSYRRILRHIFAVSREHKELVIGPAITLIPQLFSLPLFIVSFTSYCEDLESSWLRYLLIASYFTSFSPQLISFLLYVLPSSFYYKEWQSTSVARWIFRCRRAGTVPSLTFATI